MKLKTITGLILFILSSMIVSAQKISSTPSAPTVIDEVTVQFDISQCQRKDLLGFTGEVYAHTGVFIEGGSNWDHVIAGWSENIEKAKCTRVSDNVYELSITPSVSAYYNIGAAEKVISMNFVLRSADQSKQTEDLFLTVYEPGLT
ncbi:MAG: hypothetical protein JXP36_15370, partial [Bacteroidales bacterium]|nr:hypothetical protein [Bacteroidales bacterium]